MFIRRILPNILSNHKHLPDPSPPDHSAAAAAGSAAAGGGAAAAAGAAGCAAVDMKANTWRGEKGGSGEEERVGGWLVACT